MSWTNYNGGQYRVDDDGSWVTVYRGVSSSSKQKNRYWAERAAKKWIDERKNPE